MKLNKFTFLPLCLAVAACGQLQSPTRMTAEARGVQEPMLSYQMNQVNNKCPKEIARMAYANAANTSKLELGQSKQEVYRYMGVPQRVNSIRLNDNRLVEVLLYRIGHPSCEGANPMDGEFFPVVISRGKLAGYGDEYYNTMIKPVMYQAVAVPAEETPAPPPPAMVPQQSGYIMYPMVGNGGMPMYGYGAPMQQQ